LELHAPITLLAEGCRGKKIQKRLDRYFFEDFSLIFNEQLIDLGSLSKILMQKFKLREGVDPQTYGIGLKEVNSNDSTFLSLSLSLSLSFSLSL
jgi:hypothetical protein